MVDATPFSGQNIEVSLIQRVLWILNMLYNQVLAIFTVLVLWIFITTRSDLYLWHFIFSTAAYIPLMAAAIILFSEDNLITLYIRRTKRYWIHGVLLSISFVSVSFGISVEIYNKSKEGRIHFESNHAILGLVSWITVFVAIVIGLLAANTRTFSHIIRPVVVKFVHNFFGISGFLLGVASLERMLDYVEMQTTTNLYTASKWALGFITIWSLLVALKSLWRQLIGIFS